jgi:hypothetical protein
MGVDVRVVQVLSEDSENDLRNVWPDLVEAPLRKAGHAPPELTVLASPFRDVLGPVIEYVRRLAKRHPDRQVAVLLPELARRRWYHRFLLGEDAIRLRLRRLLRREGNPQLVVITPRWTMTAAAAGA